MVGVAFAIVGYGVSVAARYEKNKDDLLLAQKQALGLFALCLESILSLEDVVDGSKSTTDNERQKRYISGLSDLETANRIRNEQRRKKGRWKLLDAFFKGQGGATTILEITLVPCESKFRGLEIRSALTGFDLVRAMLTKAIKMIESNRESSDEMTDLVQDIRVDVKALVAALVHGGKYTSSLLSATLLDHIHECRRIIDINRMYYSDLYQKALGRIEHAQGDMDKEESGHQWAIDLRNNDEKAYDLNKDRKAFLELLKVMCNHWRDQEAEFKDAKIKKEDSVGKPFEGEKKVARILGLCLVMDRAQALYKMTKPGSHVAGMHWYAKQHEQSEEFKDTVRGFRKWNKPTLDKRFVYLLDLEELHLRETPLLQKWSEPVA